MSVTASAKTVTAIDLRETIATAIYRGRNGRGCKPWRHQPHSHREPYYADAVEALAAISEAGLAVVRRELIDDVCGGGYTIGVPDADPSYGEWHCADCGATSRETCIFCRPKATAP